MIVVVLLFLFVSLYFYVLFGGSDYGVGILELFSSKKNRAITRSTGYRVIGPVWEANHIWLILCIVILWVGFPNYYYVMTTQLHIPLTILLVGIIARGTAFVFRHYDAIKDKSQHAYNWTFRISSLITPMILGITFGALLSGNIVDPENVASANFYDLYIGTWCNWFSLAMGAFTASLFAFSSSVFLIGETTGAEQKYFMRKAKRAVLGLLIAGALVFIVALAQDLLFVEKAIASPYFIGALVLSSVLLYPLWKSIQGSNKMVTRALVAAQVFIVLAGWMLAVFPNAIHTQQGELSILDQTAPQAVIDALGWVLIVAGIVVLPGLYHLFKTFGLLSTSDGE